MRLRKAAALHKGAKLLEDRAGVGVVWQGENQTVIACWIRARPSKWVIAEITRPDWRSAFRELDDRPLAEVADWGEIQRPPLRNGSIKLKSGATVDLPTGWFALEDGLAAPPRDFSGGLIYVSPRLLVDWHEVETPQVEHYIARNKIRVKDGSGAFPEYEDWLGVGLVVPGKRSSAFLHFRKEYGSETRLKILALAKAMRLHLVR